MFEGMPEQFYQFLAATSRPTPNTPTVTTSTFALHHATNLPLNFPPNHPSFDPSNLLHHHHPLPLHPLQQQPPPPSRHEICNTKQQSTPSSMMSESPLPVPWSNEEVLALLKVRSSMDSSWLPADFTRDNVSRKLAEVGFKRSAEKCKEKFEEETRGFNSNLTDTCSSKNNNISNNYRLFGELEELYHHNNHDIADNDCNDHTNDDEEHPPPAPYKQLEDVDGDPQQMLSQKDQSPSSTNFEQEDELVEGNKGQERLSEDEDDDDNSKEDCAENDKSSDDNMGDDQSMDDSEKTEENTKEVVRKRKRHEKKFELFKGFCVKIVNKMMAQQEELHCKILRDMIKRDEEKIARDEAWKKHEIEKITKEMEVRAHEQAIVGDRQTKILNFLKKFASLNNLDAQSLGGTLENLVNKVPNASLSTSSILSQDSITAEQTNSPCTTNHDHNPALVTHQNGLISNIPTSPSDENVVSPSPDRLDNSKSKLPKSPSSLDLPSLNPNPLISLKHSSRLAFSKSGHTSTDAADGVMDFRSLDNENGLKTSVKDDTGRRWPRDEVLALINIRCSLFNNNGDPNDRESFAKGPLWERISQKMLELGYKRSAKRCKEKWENINKYFRKTKDLNKKRSVDSRTCPYFHQLNHLYNQGAIPSPGSSDKPSNVVASPENPIMVTLPCAQDGANTTNGATTTVHGCHGNEGTVVQVPGFDFEF